MPGTRRRSLFGAIAALVAVPAAQAPVGSPGNPVIGLKAPPGCRWEVAGSWTEWNDAFRDVLYIPKKLLRKAA